MKRSPLHSLVLAATTFFLLNCSSDSSLPMTNSQSNAVTKAISYSTVTVVDNSLEVGSDSGLSAANFITVNLTKSRDCDGGGTLKVSGTQAGVVNTTIDGVTDAQVKFTNCVVEVSSTQTITLNGTLDIDGSIDLAASEEDGVTGDGSVSYTGSLEMTGDGLEKEGTCDVDLTTVADGQGLSVDLISTGDLCGNTIDYTWTLDL